VAFVTGVISTPKELYVLSIVPSSDTTLAKIAFLPPPCGELWKESFFSFYCQLPNRSVCDQ